MSKSRSIERIEREVLVIVARVRAMTVESAQRIDPSLKVPAYAAMFLIWQNGSMRAQAIAATTGADKATVSRQIAQLEELGLVTRTEDPTDRRAQLLSLSPEGQRRLDALVADRRSDFNARLTQWSAADLNQFADSLNQFNTWLDSLP